MDALVADGAFLYWILRETGSQYREWTAIVSQKTDPLFIKELSEDVAEMSADFPQ